MAKVKLLNTKNRKSNQQSSIMSKRVSLGLLIPAAQKSEDSKLEKETKGLMLEMRVQNLISSLAC